MISQEEFKKLLGKEAQSMTEEQIEELRYGQRMLAEIIFEKWKTERNKKNLNKIEDN